MPLIEEKVSDEEIGNQLKEKYQIQMTYYRNTLETILKRPVKGYFIFSNLVH